MLVIWVSLPLSSFWEMEAGVRGCLWGRGSDVTVPRVTPLPRDTAVTHKNMLESAAHLAVSRGYRVEK